MGYHISISIPRPWCRCQHWVLKKVHLAMCLQLSYKTNLFPLYQWWKPKLTLRFYASHYSPHSWWPCGGWPTPTSLRPPTHPPAHCPLESLHKSLEMNGLHTIEQVPSFGFYPSSQLGWFYDCSLHAQDIWSHGSRSSHIRFGASHVYMF